MATTPCHLYKGLNIEDYPDVFASNDTAIPDGFLYPRWHNKNYMARVKRGQVWVEEQRVSKADVRYQNDGKVKTGGETSLFDCDGWFGFTKWHYFQIPKGTPLPESLHLDGPGEKQTNASGSRTGHHYQIELKAPMMPEAFRGLLDNLLRAAIARNVELAYSA